MYLIEAVQTIIFSKQAWNFASDEHTKTRSFSHFLGEEVNAQKARVGSWTYLVFTHFLWFNDAKLSSTQETMTPGAAQAAFGAALS